jgi:DNA-binding transcriptional ArsR family regulator
MISRAAARSAANHLKAMSNEHRLFILCQLLGGERRVAELERLTGLGQSALSQHLAKLRKSNLVRTRRESQTILYSLAGDDLDQVLGVLHRLFCTAGPGHRTAAATATNRRGNALREDPP